jgi:hypothetical protein
MFTMTEDQFRRAEGNYEGYCIACKAETGGVEPDATNYECEACGENQVFGMHELLFMEMIDFVGEEE